MEIWHSVGYCGMPGDVATDGFDRNTFGHCEGEFFSGGKSAKGFTGNFCGMQLGERKKDSATCDQG